MTPHGQDGSGRSSSRPARGRRRRTRSTSAGRCGRARPRAAPRRERRGASRARARCGTRGRDACPAPDSTAAAREYGPRETARQIQRSSRSRSRCQAANWKRSPRSSCSRRRSSAPGIPARRQSARRPRGRRADARRARRTRLAEARLVPELVANGSDRRAAARERQAVRAAPVGRAPGEAAGGEILGIRRAPPCCRVACRASGVTPDRRRRPSAWDRRRCRTCRRVPVRAAACPAHGPRHDTEDLAGEQARELLARGRRIGGQPEQLRFRFSVGDVRRERPHLPLAGAGAPGTAARPRSACCRPASGRET